MFMIQWLIDYFSPPKKLLNKSLSLWWYLITNNIHVSLRSIDFYNIFYSHWTKDDHIHQEIPYMSSCYLMRLYIWMKHIYLVQHVTNL